MTYRNMAVSVDQCDPLLATRIGVDFSTKNETKRQLAANIDVNDQLRFNGDVDCKISVDFVVRSDSGSYNGLCFLLDNYNDSGASSMELSIGANAYNSCFIDSFSLTVKPFEPVMGSASFSCYDPSAGNLSGVIDNAVNSHLETENIIYGHDCVLTGAGNVVASNIVDNLTYKKTYSRSPIYTLGSQQATSHLVDSVEVDINVQSTGLNQLIDFSGNKLNSSFGVLLKDSLDNVVSYYSPETSESLDLNLIVNSGAHVVSEGYSIGGGETLVTSAAIKEVIL